MTRLLLALILLTPAALTAQDNPNYDPDYDGDGCYSVADILGLLPLFGSCVETTPAFACGDSVLFDSYWYETVLIGGQCWFAENLRTTMYANGDLIQAGLTDGEWPLTTTGATAVYGEGSSDCSHFSPDSDLCNEAQSLAAYGRLYNWYAVDDARGLCPSGWHVPTDGEWTELEDYITSQGFVGTESTALKSTAGWSNNGNGTDDFGFSALPGGFRDFFHGGFANAGYSGAWWSSSSALARDMVNTPGISRYVANAPVGFSVRCLSNTFTIQGCTDSSFIEFNPSAELDDGSCLIPVAPGCTDSLYVEFDPLANVDDGSCSTLASTCSEVEMDGYTYSVVEIGDQCWFAENLRTTTYTNGDLIPTAVGDDWGNLTSAGQTVYGTDGIGCNNDFGDNAIDACDEDAALEAYGRLYNWYAVDDPRGLCPSGWRVPSDTDFFELEIVIGMPLDEVYTFGENRGNDEGLGSMLKDDDGGHWRGGDGTNDFAFSLLPGSYCSLNTGGFNYSGWEAHLWSSTLADNGSSNKAVERMVHWSNPTGIQRDESEFTYGYSVRCMKDAE